MRVPLPSVRTQNWDDRSVSQNQNWDDRSGARIVGMFELYDPMKGRGWIMSLRQFEIYETLRRNIRSGVFDELHLFHEVDQGHVKELTWPTNPHTKVVWHEANEPNEPPFKAGRLTFKRVMKWANANLPKGTVAVFGNSDISFDDTLHLARKNNDMIDAGSLVDWDGPKGGTKRPQAWSWTRLEVMVDGIPRCVWCVCTVVCSSFPLMNELRVCLLFLLIHN